MFFFVRFWKNDSLTGLSDDALSLARSVAQLYDADADIFPLDEDSESTYLLIAAFLSVEDRSDGEVFITDLNGDILLCKERIKLTGEKLSFTDACPVHAGLHIPKEMILTARDEYPVIFTDETEDIPEIPEKSFICVAPVTRNGRIFVVTLQNVKSSYVPYTADFIRMILLTVFLAVALAFAVSLFNSHRMVKPLKKITAATKEYAGGNFSQRISTADNYSELYELVQSFNSMADSLQMIDESRSRFVADTSHELKTPMTIISGFVDGILDGTIPPEDTEKYLKIVSDETKRLSRLVVAMLNISKIEADQLKLNISDVYLQNLIFSTLLGFEKSINDKNITVQGLSDLADVAVQADETLLGQIIYNLIDNAVKFTPVGGEIRFGLESDKKNAVLKIRNTGRGIPPEECPYIFDRFYKVDPSRGLDAGSFGIGLFIVKSIIELHHGSITVESEVDSFTEFTVRLPMNLNYV